MKPIVLLLCFLMPVLIAHAQLRGRVVGIGDGDTFTLLDSNNTRYKVRMYGIDCPERGQDYGQVARKFTSDLLYGRQVYVKKIERDRYGRTVGIVTVLPGNINANEALLKAGLAWHYSRYDHNQQWAIMEAEAKRKKLGLWQRKDAVAPWEFRKKGRQRKR